MKPIIEVRGISKQYKIGQPQRYLSLRDSVTDFFKFKNRHTEGSDFWALDDVSFDVQAGESIGIIGRNGAGKSTLLKILSRITPPTKGSVILRGRLASLLEVGTGFHPELSGRENVFMNGSILGLRRSEILTKFDEIVAFSGVEQFIDTPLKHYSSGMQLRLAFAVAAHLEPEILIIDEVLAVGDAEFQKKCLGKMDEVSRSGRTVLFVSHNLSAVLKLCPRSILLERGQMTKFNFTQQVVNAYLNNDAISQISISPAFNKTMYFKKLQIVNDENEEKKMFKTSEIIRIKVEIVINQFVPSTDFLLFIHSVVLSKRIFMIEESIERILDKKRSSTIIITISIPAGFLMQQTYCCEIGLLTGVREYIDRHDSVGSFEVINAPQSPYVKYGSREIGYIVPTYSIEIS